MGWQSNKKLEPYRVSKSESRSGNRAGSGSSIKRENRTTTLKNSAFIEKNFHETTSQPGIFTLNEDNIEAKGNLDAAEAAIVTLAAAHELEMEKGVTSKKVQDDAYEVLLKSVWEKKRRFDGSALAYCFKNFNTKERLLDAIRSTQLVTTTDTSEGLLVEAAELRQTSDQELPKISPLYFQAEALEADPLLQEIIIGSGDSYLSAFIQQLGNSDWVKYALQFERTAENQCPLCQQQLPNNFYDEVRKVFDQTYEQRIFLLHQFEKKYRGAVESFLRQCGAQIYQIQPIQQCCEFRGRPATHFGVNRPVISVSSGHLFRCEPASRFGIVRPPVSV